jgi:hypothetical protein
VTHRLFHQRQFAWHLNVLWVVLCIALDTTFRNRKTDLPAAMSEVPLHISAICRRVKLTQAGS